MAAEVAHMLGLAAVRAQAIASSASLKPKRSARRFRPAEGLQDLDGRARKDSPLDIAQRPSAARHRIDDGQRAAMRDSTWLPRSTSNQNRMIISLCPNKFAQPLRHAIQRGLVDVHHVAGLEIAGLIFGCRLSRRPRGPGCSRRPHAAWPGRTKRWPHRRASPG